MIEVKENQDGSFTITWDSNDPVESQLNHFTEQDFIDAIMEQCKLALDDTRSTGTPDSHIRHLMPYDDLIHTRLQ